MAKRNFIDIKKIDKLVDTWIFDRESFCPELDCFWLRNYDTKNEVVRTLDGKLVKAPPDDGYDDAFFFFLKDTSMTFEWLVYNLNCKKDKRNYNITSIQTLYSKLLGSGYNINFIDYDKFKNIRNVKEYMKFINSLFE